MPPTQSTPPPSRTPSTRRTQRTRRKLVAAGLTTVVLAAGATAAIPSYGGSGDDAPVTAQTNAYDAAVAAVAGEDSHEHDHNDPATKNSISRAATSVDAKTADPTTPQQAAQSRRVAAAQRAEADPGLTTTRLRAPRHAVPETRYEMAGGCYALQSLATDKWVARSGGSLVAKAATASGGAPIHFQATDLGRYLLFGDRSDFVARTGDTPVTGKTAVSMAAAPSEDADWRVRLTKDSFRFGFPDGKDLGVAPDGTLVMSDSPAKFALHTTTGCKKYPEVAVNVSGAPFAGETPYQRATGYADAHTHGMAFEFLGGDAHCGRPWHKYGAPYALRDCPDHEVAHGCAAALETALSGKPCHDPVGWPTFKDWPAPDSLTHEGTYYKWIERAWRGGLRLFTNLLVENNQLCQLYPIKHNSCDDMDSIRLQAQDMRMLERYIDAQYGGPGRGWYRIVESPFEARRVINQGRLAVIMGIETSIPFGCTIKLDQPQCTEDSIIRQLDDVHRMGVRQMELVNKFDNAFSGIAGDAGETGVLVNSANFLETGSFWAMRHCEPADPEAVDKEQYSAPSIDPQQQDALFGAIVKVTGNEQPAPVYDRPAHCNARGLTQLGEFLIEELAQRGMLFDPDHMSVEARNSALDLIESMNYPGILSSHSWSTPDAYPRILKQGGFVAPYAGDSTGFVAKWKREQTWLDDRYFWGIGYGADINGLGAQGDPRGADAPNPVTYPFPGLGGVTVDKQHSGQRVYDINVDGVAHYGLYPDWVQDLRKLAGDGIVEDMSRGAEAYLETWERAAGVKNDGCREAAMRSPLADFRDLEQGATAREVLFAVGQPHARLGHEFSYCGKRPNGSTAPVTVRFDDRGHLTRVIV